LPNSSCLPYSSTFWAQVISIYLNDYVNSFTGRNFSRIVILLKFIAIAMHVRQLSGAHLASDLYLLE